jgi:uncharacterized protein
MAFELDAVEARVLGCLIEKEMATPDYYPLSANALVNACNQKSSREPVMALSEEDVTAALDRLKHRGMSLTYSSARVVKYGHRLVERLQIGNRELALLAVLLLRGPQTLGELRGRCQSLHNFEDMEAVEGVLRKLADRAEALTKPLANRWAHLLCGDVSETEAFSMPAVATPREDRLAQLEQRVAQLEAELADFKRRFD